MKNDFIGHPNLLGKIYLLKYFFYLVEGLLNAKALLLKTAISFSLFIMFCMYDAFDGGSGIVKSSPTASVQF